MAESHLNGGQLAVTSSQCELTTITTTNTSPSLASRSGNDSGYSSSFTDHQASSSHNNTGANNSASLTTTTSPVGLLDWIKSLSFGRFKRQPYHLSSSKSSPSTPTAEPEERQTMKHGRKRRILSHLCASTSTDSEQEATSINNNSNSNSGNVVASLPLPQPETSKVGRISRPLYPTNLLIVDKANDRIEFTPSNLPMIALASNQNSSANEPNNNSNNNSESRQLEVNNGSALLRTSELTLAIRSHFAMSASPYPYLAKWNEAGMSLDQLVPAPGSQVSSVATSSFPASVSFVNMSNNGDEMPRVHTQIDFVHRFVPDLLEITNFPFYWGKMDRYEAEKLLENRPEGTFLLRDSAQEDHLFSVSFRRFHRSLHARIEQSNNKFSFDSHDPGVYSSATVCGLIKYYKDPNHCMFFEPMLTLPLNRNFPFSLQHLARATICSTITYDSVHFLPLPKRLKLFLQEYHYKQKVNVRRFD